MGDGDATKRHAAATASSSFATNCSKKRVPSRGATRDNAGRQSSRCFVCHLQQNSRAPTSARDEGHHRPATPPSSDTTYFNERNSDTGARKLVLQLWRNLCPVTSNGWFHAVLVGCARFCALRFVRKCDLPLKEIPTAGQR